MWSRRAGAALAALGLAVAAHAQDAPPAPVQDAPPAEPAQPDDPPAQPDASPARVPFAGTADDLAAKFPGVVRLREYGRTARGTPLRLVTVGAAADDAVEWAALVVAHLSGHDPDEATRLALDAAARLAERAADLPPQVAFRFVPDASPDAPPFGPRAGNATPTNEDQDGDLDEDGPDDADGDGRVTYMRVPDAAGDFAADDPAKPRAAPERADAAKGKAPAWRILVEGRDDDGDGGFNEDGPGGVDVSRNFPVGFEEHSPAAGRWTTSEPETRALMDLLLADERIAVVYEIGRAETLAAHPDWGGAWAKLPDADAKTLEGLREAHGKGAIEKRTPRAPGAGSLGATCWHQLGRLWLGRAPLGRTAPPWPLDGAEPPAFECVWVPVQGKGLPAGTQVLHPETPTPAAPLPGVAQETDSVAEFLLLLARERAQVAFARTVTSGEPGVARVETRLVNSGRLPTHTQRGADVKGRRPLNLRVRLPAGARLLAGRPLTQIERIGPGEETEPMRWVVAGPSGATVTFECAGPDTGTRTLDVRIP